MSENIDQSAEPTKSCDFWQGALFPSKSISICSIKPSTLCSRELGPRTASCTSSKTDLGHARKIPASFQLSLEQGMDLQVGCNYQCQLHAVHVRTIQLVAFESHIDQEHLVQSGVHGLPMSSPQNPLHIMTKRRSRIGGHKNMPQYHNYSRAVEVCISSLINLKSLFEHGNTV